MAKSKGTVTEAAEAPKEMALATEHKIEEFAEDIGKLLGSAKAKADGWISQRQSIVRHLVEVRDAATDLLQQLGHQAATAVRAARIGRPPGSKTTKRPVGRPPGPSAMHRLMAPPPAATKKRSGISAAGRKAISDAQKARWAALKAGGKKKSA